MSTRGATRKGDDLAFGKLFPAGGGPKSDLTGEDDQQLLALDVVVEDHLVPRLELIHARAEVLRARTLGDSEHADTVCGRFEWVV